MRLEAYEVARLVLALTALVFAVSFYRKLHDRPGAFSSVIAIAAIYTSYVLGVAESIVAHDALNLLQHGSYAVAGVAAALAAWQQRRGIISARARS